MTPAERESAKAFAEFVNQPFGFMDKAVVGPERRKEAFRITYEARKLYAAVEVFLQTISEMDHTAGGDGKPGVIQVIEAMTDSLEGNFNNETLRLILAEAKEYGEI